MEIRTRQEIAMTVMGLLWAVLGIAYLEGASSEGVFLGRAAVLLVVLVGVFLVTFSLRTWHKAGQGHHH